MKILMKSVCLFKCCMGFLLYFCCTAVKAAETAPDFKVLIFISSSMPEISLVQWMREAREMKPPAALIMRGFVQDKLSETRVFVDKLIKAPSGQGGVSIDPVLFEQYRIKAVPAVVVAAQDKFDVVYGNASLSAALRLIADKGETAFALKKALSDQRTSHD